MGSRPAPQSSEANDRSGFHAGDGRSGQVFRYQDRALRVDRWRLRDARQMQENALAHVAHVIGALRQELVAQRCETLRMEVSSFLPGKGGALALRDRGV